MSFKHQFDWQDGFMPLIQQIVGYYVTVLGSHWEDTKENTDLRILKADGLTISCRLRTSNYFKYRQDFTIRTRSQFGLHTEFDKVCMGFGDLMFYGIANGSMVDHGIRCWSLIDLNSFRYHLINYPQEIHPETRTNTFDGTKFNAYKYDDFIHSPELLVKSFNLDGESKKPIMLWNPTQPDLFKTDD